MKKRCWKGYAPVKGKKPYSKGSCRKVRRNPAPYPDLAMANELYLFFQNDENLINRRYPEFVKNLERKVKRGIYDREKAVKLFMYLADEVSKKYSKDFGDGKTHWASVPTRMELAKMLLRYYEITRDPSHRLVMNPSSSAARLRRQAEIMEMDERLVPSTMTYEDIKDDPKLIAHYKKIMTPMAWKQLIDDWIKSGIRSGSGRRDFVIPKESEYRRMVSGNPPLLIDRLRRHPWVAGFMKKTLKTSYDNKVHIFKKGSSAYVSRLGDDGYVRLHHIGAGRTIRPDLSNYVPLYIDDLRGYFVPNHESLDIYERSIKRNAFSSESDRIKGYDDDRDDVPDKPLFKSGGYAVVITFKSGEVEIGQGISKDQAERQRKYLMKQYARLKLTQGINNVSSIEVLPVTSVAKNPPR